MKLKFRKVKCLVYHHKIRTIFTSKLHILMTNHKLIFLLPRGVISDVDSLVTVSWLLLDTPSHELHMTNCGG